MKPNSEIAIVDKLELLKPSVNFGYCPEISVAIGRVDEKDGTPRNFSLGYETPKSSNGGCFARIFASDCGTGTNANIFSWYGPALSFPDLRQYQHGLRAIERIGKRLDGMYAERGASVDCADGIGRWLEACGVSAVYVRPEGERENQWLSRGEWRVLSIGEFVNLVRRNLYCAPERVEAAEVAQA